MASKHRSAKHRPPNNVSHRLAILAVYGTRPEAIKLAPVVRELRRRQDRFRVTVCSTGQHRGMLRQVERQLGLAPDHELAVMRPDQELNPLIARLFRSLDPVLRSERPHWVLVQGDTTSALAGALAAFHRQVPVGHVEAGLRTGDLSSPFPEEGNRRAIDAVATALFAPTLRARDALLAEGIPAARIHLTGNTVVDALVRLATELPPAGDETSEVLITLHRREVRGARFEGMLRALGELALRFPHLRFFFPVHRSSAVDGPARALLGHLPNVVLARPVDYPTLVQHLRSCRLVITDSGGIQEEAPTFGKRVLVLRDRTERPEGIEAGVARLVGTDPAAILKAAEEELSRDLPAEPAPNPYGDGRAAERIVRILAGEPWSEPEATQKSV